MDQSCGMFTFLINAVCTVLYDDNSFPDLVMLRTNSVTEIFYLLSPYRLLSFLILLFILQRLSFTEKFVLYLQLTSPRVYSRDTKGEACFLVV